MPDTVKDKLPEAVSIERPDGEALPVLYDSPHSGRVYPEDFIPAVDMSLLVAGEDRFVDDLVLAAPRHGVTLIKALFARTYVDVNRQMDDLDPHLMPEDWAEEISPSVNSERGVGLIFRLIGDAQPIYGRPLTAQEIRRRIDHFWRPYHDAVEREMDRLHALHGEVFHVNWHSMLPVGNALSPDPGIKRPDFVLGDMEGKACDPAFTGFVAEALSGLGYSVGINDPYKGAYIVDRYGEPEQGRHTLQIEINRGLYLDQGTLDRSGSFAALKDDLTRFTDMLGDFMRERSA